MGGGKTTCPDKDLMTSSDMKFTNQNERGRERERERRMEREPHYCPGTRIFRKKSKSL